MMHCTLLHLLCCSGLITVQVMLRNYGIGNMF